MILCIFHMDLLPNPYGINKFVHMDFSNPYGLIYIFRPKSIWTILHISAKIHMESITFPYGLMNPYGLYNRNTLSVLLVHMDSLENNPYGSFRTGNAVHSFLVNEFPDKVDVLKDQLLIYLITNNLCYLKSKLFVELMYYILNKIGNILKDLKSQHQIDADQYLIIIRALRKTCGFPRTALFY